MNDREIIDHFLERSEDAIAEADAEYGARLRRIALGVTGDPGIAEECVNDAYLEAWNRIPPNTPYGYLFAYLGRIVRFTAITRMEREKAQKRSAALVELTDELADCLPSTADVANEVEAKRLIRSVNAFLRKQPEEKRSIFIRRYWFCDPVDHIAELSGRSVGSVKMILLRMRKKLRSHLEKDGFTIG